jgi:hypothetical protein
MKFNYAKMIMSDDAISTTIFELQKRPNRTTIMPSHFCNMRRQGKDILLTKIGKFAKNHFIMIMFDKSFPTKGKATRK